MNFWKTFFATLAALFVGWGITFVLSLIFGFSLLSLFSTPVTPVKERSVLCINLDESIADSPATSPMSQFDAGSLSMNSSLTSLQALSAIEHAATDSNIEGILIYQNGTGSIEISLIEELRKALERFKLSGKFVVAYDDNYTQGEYYLASVANRVSLHPEGSFNWSGIKFSSMFYKGLIDKLNVKVDVIRPTECKYKSAGEPYFLTKMSDANRLQMEVLANSMWTTLVEDVAKSRNLDAERVKAIAYNVDANDAESAKQHGFIDAIEYEDQVDNYLEELGVKRNRDGELNKISLGEYCSANAMFDPSMSLEASKNKVGIIYAEGQIVDGNTTGDGYIFGNTLAEQIRQARLDKDIKAVVLRVNSPGGSALASDVIWREVVLLKESKPVVVSMGDYAASGGYYISAPADYIFSDRLTLTGSIGVFGTIFNVSDFLSNKLGVTFDSVGTSPNAGGFSITEPLSERNREVIMEGVDKVYKTFTSHVAEGRNLDIEKVYSIAEGRVWSGTDAVNIGLVDANGGLFDAVAKAAELADITNDYQLMEIKLPLSPIELWLQSLTMMTANSLNIDYNIYGEELNKIIEQNLFIFTNHGVQMITPLNIEVNL
ncbi:MAG: signal peptide peptidase SppA [Alistipes sp.]|nr:signal peptide peptidase SppA [Alistipes sp.]